MEFNTNTGRQRHNAMKTPFYIGETTFDKDMTYVLSEDQLSFYNWYESFSKNSAKRRTSKNEKVQMLYDKFEEGVSTLKQILQHKNYIISPN